MKRKIRENSSLVRLSSNAVVNTNIQEIQNYRAKKQESERLNKLEDLVSEMQKDLEELRAMVDKKTA